MKTYCSQNLNTAELQKGAFLEPIVLQRKKIIEALNNQHEFSDDELFFIAKYFPDILTKTMVPDERTVKAYLKAEQPISRDTFPLSIWNNDELIFASAIYEKSLPWVANDRITLEKIKEYMNTRTDEELCAFFNVYKPFDKQIIEYLKAERVQERFVPALDDRRDDIEFSDLDDGNYDREHEEQYCPVENIGCFSNDLVLLPDLSSAAPKRRVYKLDDYKSIRYPRLFHYITDLHLTNKIHALVEQGTDFYDAVEAVISKAVRGITTVLRKWREKIYDLDPPQILLIGGDVSFDFDISRLFYEYLLECIPPNTRIYVVLGNHELWDNDPQGASEHNYESIVGKYRDFFSQYDDIRFLENELAVVVRENLFEEEAYVLNEEDLFDPSKQEMIKSLISESRYLVYGGIGFAGKNREFNVLNGIYRKTVKTREQEKLLSEKCEIIYKRCMELSGGKNIVCLTHMPLSDWAYPSYKPNCYYVNGHTHKNYFDNTCHILADNQIGYSNDRFSLKQFAFDVTIDRFEQFSDGIHPISNYDYYEFGLGFGLHFTMRQLEGAELYLLKKDGIYMFVSKGKTGLCILTGGKKKKLDKKDINYYYDNLGNVADAIRFTFTDYNDALKRVSKQIRDLGGNGIIHGCIVDIDFYNHAYLNPYDGKLSFYSAPDINSRISYDTLEGLLENNPSNSLTINRMSKRIQSGKTESNQIVYREGVLSSGTAIYSPSRILNRIQKLLDYNVLQIWDEGVLKQYLKSKAVSNRQQRKQIR